MIFRSLAAYNRPRRIFRRILHYNSHEKIIANCILRFPDGGPRATATYEHDAAVTSKVPTKDGIDPFLFGRAISKKIQ